VTRTVQRLIVCTLLAVLAGDYARAQLTYRPVHPDIGQVWFAARAVLHGQNPYALIGPGRAFEWPAPMFYPLPAALTLLPLAPFSEGVAVFLFVAIGLGTFLWAVTENGWSGLWSLASMNLQHAVLIAQWSPLLAGAFAIAPLSAILIAKPTIGVAVFAARPSMWAIAGTLVLILLAFVLQPGWWREWRHAMEAATLGGGGRFPYTPPIIQPGGVLTLLALLRWRRPEARLLAVLACVPQTTLPYEGLLLFLVPRGWRQMLTLTVLSWCATIFVRRVYQPDGLTQGVIAYGPTMTALLYLPCTVMVLRRENEGLVPLWLERRITAWPRWLSGQRTSDAS
jgi:uncharacterized protein YjeT (DUF2065 family)